MAKKKKAAPELPPRHFLLPDFNNIPVANGMQFFGGGDMGALGQEITRTEAEALVLGDMPGATEPHMGLFLAGGQFFLKDGRRIVTQRAA